MDPEGFPGFPVAYCKYCTSAGLRDNTVTQKTSCALVTVLCHRIARYGPNKSAIAHAMHCKKNACTTLECLQRWLASPLVKQ